MWFTSRAAGFEPFNQSVDLSAGTDSAIKPTWTPEATIAIAPTVADTPPPVEVAPQPAKKLPIPIAAEQEKIAKQLNDLYKTSQSGPKDPAKRKSFTTSRPRMEALPTSATCC